MASIKKQANGRWRARWREHPGANLRSSTFDKRSDAERFLVDELARLARGDSIDLRAGRMPLLEWWDTWVSRQLWRRATATSVDHVWQRIHPVLGRRAIGAIRSADVTAFVGQLLGQGVAPSTVRLTLGKLRQCAKAAVVKGIIVVTSRQG